MKRTGLATLLVAGSLSLSSCIGRPANVQSAPATSGSGVDQNSRTSHAFRSGVVLVDATGSYDQLVPALRRLARFAGEELSAGDTICAFWIKGEIGEAPDFIIEPTTVPVAQRRIGDPAEIDGLKLRQQIQRAFSDYANAGKFRKAGRTDLLQAITYAGRMLHAGGSSDKEKWLLIFTDLEDNQRKDVNLDLAGVNVRVFYVPARNDLKGMDEKIEGWNQRFKQANAASVAIYDVGQSETLGKLIANH